MDISCVSHKSLHIAKVVHSISVYGGGHGRGSLARSQLLWLVHVGSDPGDSDHAGHSL